MGEGGGEDGAVDSEVVCADEDGGIGAVDAGYFVACDGVDFVARGKQFACLGAVGTEVVEFDSGGSACDAVDGVVACYGGLTVGDGEGGVYRFASVCIADFDCEFAIFVFICAFGQEFGIVGVYDYLEMHNFTLGR